MNPTVAHHQDLGHKSSRSGLCVLVVDSSRVCLTITSTILSIYKYKVIVARYGVQALSMIRQSKIKIDLVMTEFLLPDMCGIELMEKVRELKKMPIVFLSSFRNIGEKMQCLSKGGDFCYEKPMSMKEAKLLWQFKILNVRGTTYGNVKELPSLKLEEVVEVTSKKRRIFWATEFYGKSIKAGEGTSMKDVRANNAPKIAKIDNQICGSISSRMQNRKEGLQHADSINATRIDTTLRLRVGSHEDLCNLKNTQFRRTVNDIKKQDDAIKIKEESLLTLSLRFGSQISDENMNTNSKVVDDSKLEASDAASSSAAQEDCVAYNPINRGRIPRMGNIDLMSHHHV
ncbi:two-component response regulator ARR10-like [Impatiens glandulifera]|uniref:two-component response regulator ARR10-like n=1 Tax=Impatiens glandulifera TaxID=253017 RepID=UPI001FB10CC6|nr:two-component response regulator ARR10-like [Impatiens glandulifera]